MTLLLPPGFAALEPFAQAWAPDNAADRARIRDNAGPDEMTVFYAAVEPLLAPALAQLDTKPLALHDEAEQRLMRLLLTFTHIALATEIQREDEKSHARLRAHLTIRRAPADLPSQRAAVAS